jgi:YVTN family beta-propeller protein
MLIDTRRYHLLVAGIFIVVLLSGSAAAAPFAYIPNYGGDSVTVLDTATNTVTATVPVGSNPYAVAVSPDGSTVYVTNSNGVTSISVINATSNTVTATVRVGALPMGVAVSPDGSTVYVANWGENTVWVINTASNTHTATVSGMDRPSGVAVSPDGSTAYTSNSDGTVSVINATSNTITATIHLGSLNDVVTPAIAVSPDGSMVYVTSSVNGVVFVINAASNTVTATVNVGDDPYAVAVSPDGSTVYVTNSNSNTVSVINAASHKVTATVSGVGSLPYGIAVSPDGSTVYVANTGGNTVSVINATSNTGTTKVTVGKTPYSVGKFIVGPPRTATPVITRPVYAGATSVSGTAVAGASIILKYNGVAQRAVTATGGVWTVTVPALVTSDTISVTARLSPSPMSAPATAPVVTRPVIVPVTSFTGTPTTGVSPLTVTFTDQSTNTPTSWHWDFGDSNTTNATVQNPVHTYATAGTYTVNLTATNTAGSSYSRKVGYITVTAPVIAPTAGFTGTPTTGVSPLTVTFTDQSTNTPTSWLWDFGDNDATNATVQSPVHTYSSAGSYTVNLTATNTAGSSYSRKVGYITVTAPVIAPTAGFTGTPTTGVSPLTVTFTDQSTNTPTSWHWDFGDNDATNATVQNPVHTYSSAGTYTVNLTATNTAGSSYSRKVGYITVIGKPVAGFTGTPTTGVSPLTVTFTDQSTNTPTSWHWDFGDSDATNATVQNPVHTYATAGTYSVNLTVTTSAGSNSLVQTGYIAVSSGVVAPIAAFGYNASSGTAPLTVQFTDISENTPTSWLWDFGDGATSAVQNATHTYTTPGTYSVNLTATNSAGSNSQVEADIITVSAPVIAPSAGFTGTPTTGVSPLTVTFTDQSTNTPTSWLWDFGDNDATNATVKNPVHTYATAGTYSVNLTVTTSAGSNSLVQTGYITVSSGVVAPVAAFGYNASSGTAPLTVQFTDISENAPTSWLWDFGDGATSTVQNATHTYTTPGTYSVNLTATNSAGSNSQVEADIITVSAAAVAPVASFTSNATTGTIPLTVTFTDQSTNTPTSWYWDFGDSDATNATVQNPVHTYSSAGTYTVNLTATNTAGSSYSRQVGYITVTAPVITPAAGFTGTPTTGVSPLTVTFTDQSANTPTSWLWDFGDNDATNATVQNPVHTYSSAGSYTVNLTATNTAGSSYSRQVDFITVTSPVIIPVTNFTGTPTTGVSPLTVTFTDQSTNTPTSWLWDFGDNDATNATVQNPVHTYSSAGSYTVNLTATNTAGNSYSRQVDFITVTSPVIIPVTNFTGTPTTGVSPLTVTFTDQSANTPTSWLWDFGDNDATNATVQNPVHTYSSAGSYTVNLTATNTAGSSYSRQVDFITVTSPVIIPVTNFTGTPTTGVSPLTVTFTDQSTNTPTSWLWDFGDNDATNATVQSPVHTYSSAGSYTVNLTATNSAGSSYSRQVGYIVVTSSGNGDNGDNGGGGHQSGGGGQPNTGGDMGYVGPQPAAPGAGTGSSGSSNGNQPGPFETPVITPVAIVTHPVPIHVPTILDMILPVLQEYQFWLILIIVIIIVIAIMRRWWVRRQTPVQFKKYK